jgi:hypothetical protein
MRRFLNSGLDAGMEDAEQRKFPPGFLEEMERRRVELLSAVLTIWRWGRQNAASLTHGKPLGGFEQWAEWCRDPLLTLGLPDPVERISQMKARDPIVKTSRPSSNSGTSTTAIHRSPSQICTSICRWPLLRQRGVSFQRDRRW